MRCVLDSFHCLELIVSACGEISLWDELRRCQGIDNGLPTAGRPTGTVTSCLDGLTSSISKGRTDWRVRNKRRNCSKAGEQGWRVIQANCWRIEIAEIGDKGREFACDVRTGFLEPEFGTSGCGTKAA